MLPVIACAIQRFLGGVLVHRTEKSKPELELRFGLSSCSIRATCGRPWRSRSLATEGGSFRLFSFVLRRLRVLLARLHRRYYVPLLAQVRRPSRGARARDRACTRVRPCAGLVSGGLAPAARTPPRRIARAFVLCLFSMSACLSKFSFPCFGTARTAKNDRFLLFAFQIS